MSFPSTPSAPDDLPSDGDVDLAQLEDITGGAPDILEDIVAELDTTSAELVAEVGRALDHGDAKSAMRAAHTIKGSGGMVGAHRLRVVSEAMEVAAATGDLEAARGLLGELREARDKAVAILRGVVARAKQA